MLYSMCKEKEKETPKTGKERDNGKWKESNSKFRRYWHNSRNRLYDSETDRQS